MQATAHDVEGQQFPSVINLNVGGRIFATRLSTLRKYPESMLAVMFSGRHRVDKDLDGNYFIDRDGTYFLFVLNFLRDDNDLPPVNYAEDVLKEAMFYGIQALVDRLKNSPPLFAEYVVRENVRKKLGGYQEVKEEIISLAKLQVMESGAITSVVRLIISKNQPVPRDLQFSKQVYKQYYRKFRLYTSFESCYGKYFINLPAERVKGQPDAVMDLVAACLSRDLLEEGYKGIFKSEGVHDEDRKLKTITWCDEEFHVSSSCHMFRFDWLDTPGRH
ncbi:BTB/POZ domain-containing protein KCTD7-like [Mizuhopecten yessoensis]|uniref:BTB/POZ domain-containing protein KCTD7 n=1 Tax=Mizuhopecten yessoensis TaxID=6573 RepID=A0A210Q3S5_MIZYE|nr:BTB/POZ domain-containing protein KCTD7-like [Mizuhopecten yessoensis]OWF43329.1 BTB/POZ domain-containing protein KCTD7 [Mizuhopecten yessoensis]